jgi:hypothetical protein
LTFIGFQIKLRPMRLKGWSKPVLVVLIAKSLIMPKITSKGL